MRTELLTDTFFDSLERSAVDLSEAVTLPPACYTSAEFYAFEKEALYAREWLCAGRETQVPNPGDFFTITIADEPIIVVRNAAGELRAMSAVCQHRAMLVAEGSGNVRGFLCPYHHWSYSLNGDLIAAPAMNRTCDFDRGAFGLPGFAVELWHGFIFVNLDRAAAPLAPRLAHVSAAIANYDLASAEGPARDPAA
ncbi:MAG: aromatic ring-hydroxylating oxygenase subunit alpha, partial [Janthinobacterium lividum]